LEGHAQVVAEGAQGFALLGGGWASAAALWVEASKSIAVLPRMTSM
jgi:hypothetical protein